LPALGHRQTWSIADEYASSNKCSQISSIVCRLYPPSLRTEDGEDLSWSNTSCCRAIHSDPIYRRRIWVGPLHRNWCSVAIAVCGGCGKGDRLTNQCLSLGRLDRDAGYHSNRDATVPDSKHSPEQPVNSRSFARTNSGRP
jgi:hypothetical protein